MYDVFSLPKYDFPKDFLWGSSTAAHQIEGDNKNNNWWVREQKGETEHKSGKACNSYEMYKEDVKLLEDYKHQAYRFSIEWSRIESEEGVFNEKEVEHYLSQMRLLEEKGIKSFVTLWHFTNPIWFENKGAFSKRENIDCFIRFVDYIVPKIDKYVAAYNVFNEFNLDSDLDRKINYTIAHGRGYQAIKTHSNKPVGTAHAFPHWMPYRINDKYDNLKTQIVDYNSHEFFLHAIRTGEIQFMDRDAVYADEVKNSIDFWSVNYYTRHFIDARKKDREVTFDHKRLKMINKDFYLEEMYPEGLIAVLERLKDYPVYITENGCSCDNDDFRIVYIALHLSALKEAMNRGVCVKGFFYWSLLDNYEWGSFTPRFGLTSVHLETFKRTPKKSASFYREIIENGGFSGETVKKYLSTLPTLG